MYAKLTSWDVRHPHWSTWIHCSLGAGVAWLVSLAWHYALHALILGIVFLAAGVAGHIYPFFAKR